MNIIEQIERVFPIPPTHLRSVGECSALNEIIQCFAENLDDLTPDSVHIAERVLAQVVVRSQIEGLFVGVGKSEAPLIWVIVDLYLQNALPSMPNGEEWRDKLLIAVWKVATHSRSSILAEVPTWKEAPLIRWLLDYVNTPLHTVGLYWMHSNLMSIVISGLDQDGDALDLSMNINKMTSSVRRYAKLATERDIQYLGANPSPEELFDLFLTLVQRTPPPDPRRNGVLLRDYVSRIRRLLAVDANVHWAGCRQPSLINRKEANAAVTGVVAANGVYEQLSPKCARRKRSLEEARQYEFEICDGLNTVATVDEESSETRVASMRRTRSKPVHFFDPWLATIYKNPTRHTPGVLSIIEIALMFQGAYELENSSGFSRSRGENARAVLLCGLFYGWGKQLLSAMVEEHPPEPFEHPGLVILGDGNFASVRPAAPVGYPHLLVPSEENYQQHLEYLKSHHSHFESIDASYFLGLHPWVADAIMKVLLRRERGDLLFPKPEYDQAITDLSRILIRYSPNSQKITPGRLSASFQGYAASYGLDGPARYAICGRASKKDEIPINYTRLSIAKVCEEQWKWIDEMIDEIRAQMSYIRRFRKLTRDLVTPPRSNGLPDGMRSRLSGFAGSCWVPKVDIFRELIEFVRLRSQRSDLPRHEYINWQMRRLAFESVVLMCFRDFEFDRFRFPGNRTTGVVIVYEAKRKYWESSDHTFGVKFIPAYLHARWWSVVEACAADCSGDGALWCLRDEEFNRIPFSLQKELDYTLSCMGYSTAYIRAYGLRHLGRTMYRDSGMPEWMLNFLMNHYGEGYEKFNPVLGTNFVDYYDRYNRYADIVRDRLGMVE